MVRLSIRRPALYLLVLNAILLAGCRPAIEPVTASGTVSVDGKPVSGLVVSLLPIGGTTGPKAISPVLNGSFTFDAEDRLHGGAYQVRFAVMPAMLLSQMPPEASQFAVSADQRVPPKFDIDSELTWEISPGADNTSTFEIELRAKQ